MTTRQDYAEAATLCASMTNDIPAEWLKHQNALLLAARVLRALAEDAVLCKETTDIRHTDERAIVTYTYHPLDPQP